MHISDPHAIIEVGNVRVMIYGPPGVGKTTLGFTAEKPLLLDYNNGVRRINPKYRGYYATGLTSWPLVVDAVSELVKRKSHEFKTVVTDTAGNLLEILGENLKATNSKFKQADGSLTQKGWGALSSVFKQSYYLPLWYAGLDVVYIAHSKEDKSKEEPFSQPDIPGSTMGYLLQEMDLVGYIHIRGGRKCITFTPAEGCYAKNSAELPDFMYLDEWNLSAIIQAFRTAVNAESSEYIAYMEQMQEINRVLAEAETGEQLNAIVAMCGEITKENAWIYTAATEAKQLIGMRAKELKIEREKGGLYIVPRGTEEVSTESELAQQTESITPDAVTPVETVAIEPPVSLDKNAPAEVLSDEQNKAMTEAALAPQVDGGMSGSGPVNPANASKRKTPSLTPPVQP